MFVARELKGLGQKWRKTRLRGLADSSTTRGGSWPLGLLPFFETIILFLGVLFVWGRGGGNLFLLLFFFRGSGWIMTDVLAHRGRPETENAFKRGPIPPLDALPPQLPQPSPPKERSNSLRHPLLRSRKAEWCGLWPECYEGQRHLMAPFELLPHVLRDPKLKRSGSDNGTSHFRVLGVLVFCRPLDRQKQKGSQSVQPSAVNFRVLWLRSTPMPKAKHSKRAPNPTLGPAARCKVTLFAQRVWL